MALNSVALGLVLGHCISGTADMHQNLHLHNQGQLAICRQAGIASLPRSYLQYLFSAFLSATAAIDNSAATAVAPTSCVDVISKPPTSTALAPKGQKLRPQTRKICNAVNACLICLEARASHATSTYGTMTYMQKRGTPACHIRDARHAELCIPPHHSTVH